MVILTLTCLEINSLLVAVSFSCFPDPLKLKKNNRPMVYLPGTVLFRAEKSPKFRKIFSAVVEYYKARQLLK